MRGWPALLATMLLLLFPSAGCKRGDDCELYRSCPGDLIDWAVEKVARDEQEICRSCLELECLPQANECSVDWKCNLSARCRMSTSPQEYQRCVRDLYRHGFTDGREPKKPWEGHEKNAFDDCRRRYCSDDCFRDPYDCKVAIDSYGDASVTLAVQKFGVVGTDEPVYGAARGVEARTCYLDSCPENWKKADENGHIELALEPNRFAESVYFELRPDQDAGVPDFPHTRYYPRMMGDSESMLASVYVVRSADVRNGNNLLGFGDQVLEDQAQSVILPDGCTREPVSVPNVRIRVTSLESGKVFPQCHQEELGCFPQCSKACVWYSNWFQPGRDHQSTDELGSGAGAVALPEGRYDIEVLNDNGDVVARRRRVRMEKGWMTIVRTWPVLEYRNKTVSGSATPRSTSPEPVPTAQPPARSGARAP
ncbi:MAG TPA: hypothetical protein VFZ61_18665 [Polyangiales bacterium]